MANFFLVVESNLLKIRLVVNLLIFYEHSFILNGVELLLSIEL